MFKEFVMKQMLKRQLKGVPEAEQEKIIAMVQKNPALFEQIAKEIQIEIKKGKDQQSASILVMRRHQAELQKLVP